jgi:hypothetical protein
VYLQVGWKRTQPYSIKCRFVKPMLPATGAAEQGAATQEMVIKFECQLYRVKEERYILDLQRLEGPLYVFLDLADTLMAELKL